MAIIKLSKSSRVDSALIDGCEICQKEDNCWVVKWDTGNGIKESDKFPSNPKANEYADSIVALIEEVEKEPDFE